ncbi:MAG: flagellar hook-associated protein FlgL [Phycisphaerae bacterium]|nr:flagellar hook-associated protein FlgL [Phycisphaerae bacterium]
MSGWGTIYNTTTRAMSVHSQRMADLQLQVSTGARIARASDDPSDANRVMHLASEARTIASYTENLHNVVQSMQEGTNALQEVSSALSRTRELLTQAVNGTFNESNRRTVAQEINSLLEQVVSLANHESMGRYVFSGASTGVRPYVVERTDGDISHVRYEGSYEDMPVPVANGVLHSGLMVGEEVFRSDDRQDAQFLGTTGAAAGEATNSVQGDVWLTLTHTTTNYAAGTHGLAAGDDSADGGTILGEHTLNVYAATNEIALDGGPRASFTAGETNVQVTNADGDVVYVDVSGWSGNDETVTVTGTGTASIDDGESTTALTSFGGELAVTDADSGQVLNVDTSGIVREGIEPVRMPGTYDVFGTLIAVRDVLAGQRGLDTESRKAFMEESLASLEEVAVQVTEQMTSIGARISAMDSLQTTLENVKSEAEMEKGRLADADLAQVAADLARTQTLYQTTLASASRVLSLSLLDFI